jgi:hypothetical protein
MRAALLVPVLTIACVSSHPIDPEWRRAQNGERSFADAGLPPGPEPVPEWQVIGRSVEGRPLRMMRVGRGARRVLWIGGIHGDEREGSVATAELPRTFLQVPGAAEAVTLTILEDANPDGSAHDTRGNGNGVDLNRNYPATNYLPGADRGTRPLDQPEAKVVYDLVLEERPHAILVAHGWRGDHFVNFDGPPEAEHLANLFAERSGFPVRPSDKITPTPGSLGSWAGRTLKMPILTLEYLRGSEPLANWIDTRKAILAVVLDG